MTAATEQPIRHHRPPPHDPDFFRWAGAATNDDDRAWRIAATMLNEFETYSRGKVHFYFVNLDKIDSELDRTAKENELLEIGLYPTRLEAETQTGYSEKMAALYLKQLRLNQPGLSPIGLAWSGP